MSAFYIISLSYPSTCRKLLKLVKIWQSYDKNFDCSLRHSVDKMREIILEYEANCHLLV